MGNRSSQVDLARLQQLLRDTIARGAPMFNEGDQSGCYNLYRDVAKQCLAISIPQFASKILNEGLEKAASAATPYASAWDMRRAFDEILRIPLPDLRRPSTSILSESSTISPIDINRSSTPDIASPESASLGESKLLRIIGVPSAERKTLIDDGWDEEALRQISDVDLEALIAKRGIRAKIRMWRDAQIRSSMPPMPPPPPPSSSSSVQQPRLSMQLNINNNNGSSNISRSDNSFEIDPAEIELGSVLGRGYFGEAVAAVYHGAEIVVKRLQRFPSEAEARDFVKEAEILASVRHPNIIGYIGISRPLTGDIWLVLERAQLGSLEKLLLHQRLLSSAADLPLVMKMLSDAAAGVLHLHALVPPIIHRDIALRNLFVGADMRVKVGDLGLARQTTIGATSGQTVTTFGPVQWMAPEAIAFGRYSTASDVFMFGSMMYELFARRPPFSHLNVALVGGEVVRGIRPDPLPVKHCPEPVAALMLRCWAAAPIDRPSMVEVMHELRQLAKDPDFGRQFSGAPDPLPTDKLYISYRRDASAPAVSPPEAAMPPPPATPDAAQSMPPPSTEQVLS